jgi:hypothetical protein
MKFKALSTMIRAIRMPLRATGQFFLNFMKKCELMGFKDLSHS